IRKISIYHFRSDRVSSQTMIVYQSRFLTRGEVWFDNSPGAEPVDWIVYHQRPEPIPKANWRPFYTRIIDLMQSPDALLSQMDGFTAADIRKAEKKDHTICQQLNSADPKVMDRFCAFYDRFAAHKNINPADRHWLERTANAEHLDLWVANSPEGEPM